MEESASQSRDSLSVGRDVPFPQENASGNASKPPATDERPTGAAGIVTPRPCGAAGVIRVVSATEMTP